MRILAFLTLPLLTIAIPASAFEYSPAATPSSAAHGAKKPSKHGGSTVTARRRIGNRARTIDGSSGLIITDFKPDSQRSLANQAYLPHVSENLTYETADYRNRFWRLKKVSPGSLVASVKYRF